MTDKQPNGETSPIEQCPRKKPYQPPVLQRWGTLEELTRSQGLTGRKDGGILLKTR